MKVRFSDTLSLVLAALMAMTALNTSLGVRLVLTVLSGVVIVALLVVVQQRARAEARHESES